MSRGALLWLPDLCKNNACAISDTRPSPSEVERWNGALAYQCAKLAPEPSFLRAPSIADTERSGLMRGSTSGVAYGSRSDATVGACVARLITNQR